MVASNRGHRVGYIFGLVQGLGEGLRLRLHQDLGLDEVFLLFLFVVDEEGESGGFVALAEGAGE